MDHFRGHNFVIYGCIEVMSLLPALDNHILSYNLKLYTAMSKYRNIFIAMSLWKSSHIQWKNATLNQHMDDFRGHNFAICEYI